MDNSLSASSYKVPGESFSLFITIILILLVAWVFSLWNFWVVIGLAIFAVISVRVQQSQFLGNAMRLHGSQFPEIYQVFEDYARQLGISRASLYINQDPSLMAFTMGIEHCTVVLSSALVEQLDKKELSFVIGHELGHYAAGHTKITTLLSPVGNGHYLTNFIFSFWNRKAEYSSDRCGLILTKDLDSAISVLIKLAVGGRLYKQVDIHGYLSQLKKATDGSAQFSEMFVDHPLITNRVKALYYFWKQNFVKINSDNL